MIALPENLSKRYALRYLPDAIAFMGVYFIYFALVRKKTFSLSRIKKS
jgi:hypothetical protein